MASQRTLDALRRLADRPGTEAEGILARETLRRLSVDPDRPLPRSLEDILRAAETPMTPEEQAAIRIMEEQRLAASARAAREAEIRIYERMVRGLKKGDRVYFNRVRYPKNDPGVVSKPADAYLNVQIKLDRNIWPTRVNAYFGGVRCLSVDPLD